MQIKNIHDAKSHLSQLIALAYKGEEVIICKAGRPLVRLIRYQEEPTIRKAGFWRGKVVISQDFGETNSNIEAAFRGDSH